MVQLDPANATNIDMSGLTAFAVDQTQTDGPQSEDLTPWNFPDFTTNFGYYRDVPELRSAINAWATWVLGKGWTAGSRDSVILESITGWGIDSFNEFMWNMLVMLKVNGDSFAQIMRSDDGTLINMKCLTPDRMTIQVAPNGRIKRYDYTDPEKKMEVHKFQPHEIFHLCNDRIGDEIHGNSIIKAIKWIIDSRNEAMEGYRRVSHRSTVRILYADEQDATILAGLGTTYKDAVNKGYVMIMPGKRSDYDFDDLTPPPAEAFLAWMRYLESSYYKALNMPKIAVGDAEGIPESGGIMSYVTYEPQFNRAINFLQDNLWEQVGIRVKFTGPVSLAPTVGNTQDKNQDQTQAAQPSDVQQEEIQL